jgi:hypothetical protein
VNRWRSHLLEGEAVRWEGRPAPRAFTFRNWRRSVRVLALCLPVSVLAATVFFGHGMSLPPATGFIAAVFLGLIGFWGTVGHLFYARLLWEGEFYALTDRRLLVKSGLFGDGVSTFDLGELTEVFLFRQGPALGTVTVRRRTFGRPINLFCLEYPELLLGKLPRSLSDGSWIVRQAPGCEGKN